MLITLILIIAIFSRYLILSYIIEKLVTRSNLGKVFTFKRKPDQQKREIILSLYSSIIFGISFYFLYDLWLDGRITLASNSEPLWFHLICLLCALLFHETYYYWLHRIMHHKSLYPYLHKGHHDSVEVSSWTAFAFDPLETIFQVIPFYIIIFTIPLHLYSVIILLIIMSVSATINHLNYEIYPKFFRRIFPFNQLIGATHHALHHKEFKTNYGLYFTFWDKWMKTESTKY